MTESKEIVVDTDVISYILKGDTRAIRYRELARGKQLIISFMSVAELEFWGLSRNWGTKKIETLNDLLRHFIVYPSDRSLCLRWAKVMNQGRKTGKPVHVQDAWIAATALEIGTPLLTHNTKDFLNIPSLEVWTAKS
mgnify:CR=1 FL=1